MPPAGEITIKKIASYTRDKKGYLPPVIFRKPAPTCPEITVTRPYVRVSAMACTPEGTQSNMYDGDINTHYSLSCCTPFGQSYVILGVEYAWEGHECFDFAVKVRGYESPGGARYICAGYEQNGQLYAIACGQMGYNTDEIWTFQMNNPPNPFIIFIYMYSSYGTMSCVYARYYEGWCVQGRTCP